MTNFWWTDIPRRNFLNFFPCSYVDSWPKILLFRKMTWIYSNPPFFLGPTIFKIPQPNWYYYTYLKFHGISTTFALFEFHASGETYWVGLDPDRCPVVLALVRLKLKVNIYIHIQFTKSIITDFSQYQSVSLKLFCWINWQKKIQKPKLNHGFAGERSQKLHFFLTFPAFF